MRSKLEERLAGSARPAEVAGAGAGDLPFADGTFDVAVTTLVLCTVPDPASALGELLRVLRPGGRLLFAEHVRSSEARTARVQDVVKPVWQFVARGCHPNRDTLAAIEGAGFVVEELERTTMRKAPAIVREVIVGVARRPAAL